jgi:hypothetical protein
MNPNINGRELRLLDVGGRLARSQGGTPTWYGTVGRHSSLAYTAHRERRSGPINDRLIARMEKEHEINTLIWDQGIIIYLLIKKKFSRGENLCLSTYEKEVLRIFCGNKGLETLLYERQMEANTYRQLGHGVLACGSI